MKETEFEIPPMAARAFKVSAGQFLRITDVEGGQPGDLLAFAEGNLQEAFSQARTRVENRTTRPSVGHGLWSNAQPPRVLLTIQEDSGGGHDLLYPACCRYALRKRFHVERDGCLEMLARAVAPHGIPDWQIPDPFNLFFRIAIDREGGMTRAPSLSGPGSCIVLRAETDCLVAVSTCPVPRAGRSCTGYRIHLH